MKICIYYQLTGLGVPQGEPSVHEGVGRGTVWQGASDEGKGGSASLMFENLVEMFDSFVQHVMFLYSMCGCTPVCVHIGTPESLQNICGHSGSIQVAVKILSNLQVENMKTFYEEMEVMQQFTHFNIVNFLGMLSHL